MRFLYCITNLKNGKLYIGQTTNFKKRMSYHKYNPSDSLIHRAILKYGRDNFKYEILGEYEEDLIDNAEIKAIEEFNTRRPSGYNIETGGNLNKSFDLETKQKMAKIKKALLESPEYRNKISKGLKKYYISNPTAASQMSIERMGKKQSLEHKAKLRDGIINFFNSLSEEEKRTRQNKRAYNLHNNKKCSSKSGYRGVYFKKSANRFEAYTSFDSKRIYIGHYDTAEEAARAYDNKSKELFGAFARLNFPETGELKV